MLNSVIAGIIAAMSVTFSVFDLGSAGSQNIVLPADRKLHIFGKCHTLGGCAVNKGAPWTDAMLFVQSMFFCNDIGGNNAETGQSRGYIPNKEDARNFIREERRPRDVVWLNAEG